MEETVAQTQSEARPSVLQMSIHTGMLESMGLNMYTSIAKSLVEFVANGYDADADRVTIAIPFDEIERAREALREAAKKEVEKYDRDQFTVLYDPLPDDIRIVVSDNGHGMSALDIQKKFLVINRNRREASSKSESGKRYVMGRKGLGKLAGFGAAGRIEVRSKRAGETYATVFVMDFENIKKFEHLNGVEFQPAYEDKLDPEEHGTTVTLSALRCDALKAKEPTIRKTLAQNFFILGDGFEIVLNGEKVEEEDVDYEFYYPDASQRDGDGFATEQINVEDLFKFPIRYVVKFRARESDNAGDGAAEIGNPGGRKKVRGHLPAKLRGARIYCNKRLAAGPTLLNLHTGMHNFHSQSYMECIVLADDLDRQKVDHTGTNRTDLKTDNVMVDALYETVTEIMRLALAAHGKHRDQQADKDLDQDEFTKGLLSNMRSVSKRTRVPARKILRIVASHAGIKSEMYREMAPLVLQSMNAGAVLTRLIELGADPKSIQVVAHELAELAKVETIDVLKHYRGRVNGIEALRKLQQKADATWGGPQFEGELHGLLKENPWLIRPEYDRYLTSDKPMDVVARKLDRVLKIDSAVKADNGLADKDRRPDLVFVLVSGVSPDTVVIVELKSPNVSLAIEHLNQLEAYMLQAREVVEGDRGRKDVRVFGYLIGSLPNPDTKSSAQKLLLDKRSKATPNNDWGILTVSELLDGAERVHSLRVGELEEEEKVFEEELT